MAAAARDSLRIFRLENEKSSQQAAIKNNSNQRQSQVNNKKYSKLDDSEIENAIVRVVTRES